MKSWLRPQKPLMLSKKELLHSLLHNSLYNSNWSHLKLLRTNKYISQRATKLFQLEIMHQELMITSSKRFQI